MPCAAFMGFMMFRSWRSATEKWVWILPALWFAFRALPYAALHSHSVLSQDQGFWFHFSGAACGADISNCRDFYAFSVPLIRTLSYSAAAMLASRVLEHGSRANANPNATT